MPLLLQHPDFEHLIFSGWYLLPIAAQGKSLVHYATFMQHLCFLTYFMSCFSDHLKYEIIDNYLR